MNSSVSKLLGNSQLLFGQLLVGYETCQKTLEKCILTKSVIRFFGEVLKNFRLLVTDLIKF